MTVSFAVFAAFVTVVQRLATGFVLGMPVVVEELRVTFPLWFRRMENVMELLLFPDLSLGTRMTW